MNPIDLSLYLVLDPDLCGGPEGMVRTARVAAENGVTVVQLRAPGWKKKQWLETARELKAVLAPLGVPLIINDQIDVALAVDADGVHIGQDDLPAVETRRLIGPDKILGATAATVAAAQTAEREGADYIGSGAMFPTRTKAGKPVLPMSVLAQIKQAVQVPVVAIGGITADNLLTLKITGVDGVAIVSAIMDSADPAAATQEILSRWCK